MALRKRKKVVEPEYVIVPAARSMSDEIFMKHFNARHRRSDIPGYVIDVPYNRMTEYGYFKSFHDRCHQAEADGDYINGITPEYDHEHEEE